MRVGTKMLSRRSSTLLLALIVFVGTLLIASNRLSESCPDSRFCIDLSSLQRKPKPATEQPGNSNPKKDPACAGFPDTSNVLLVMKTGASEAYSKIPTQVLTNTKCLPEFFIFGDMEQKIAGYKIHDSLDNVKQEIKMKNDDFEIYFHQKQCPVDQENCNKNYDTSSKGWVLDKYKNVHIAEKVFKLRPDYDWYLYTDADTYVVWSTMVKWLKTLDPEEPRYIGSVVEIGGFPFGHGGSGYLVSRAAMQKLFEGKDNVANMYDATAKESCCGDFVFAKAMKEVAEIDVENKWPILNGEKPHTIPYGDEEWCQPIATMHHVTAEELSDIHSFERQRGYQSPVRIHELYDKFVQPHIMAVRDMWDNLSDDEFYVNKTATTYPDGVNTDLAKFNDLSELEEVAYHSFEDCRAACESRDDCFQYRFIHQACGISKKFKHGKPSRKKDEDDPIWKSGWNLPKIREWVQSTEKCDSQVDWL